MAQTPLDNVVSHWSKLFEGFWTSSDDFYAAVERGLEAWKIDALSTKRVSCEGLSLVGEGKASGARASHAGEAPLPARCRQVASPGRSLSSHSPLATPHSPSRTRRDRRSSLGRFCRHLSMDPAASGVPRVPARAVPDDDRSRR